MIGKLKKLKDNLGNYIFPITSTKAVYMTDGQTTLETHLDTINKTIESNSQGDGILNGKTTDLTYLQLMGVL